ncbi:MAG: orotidine-5'-phosphate decarboxylase [Solobacterium sp.]|nr:orotidine-5'-phosphate decarboxylase [Solobacterium sp.]
MSRTIIALDFSTREQVIEFLKQFEEPVYVKIGMELTYACGLDIIREVKSMGHKIFLDLKLHDIPNTVKGGMKNLAALGVDIVNCHCAGGIEMMKAAKQGLIEGTPEGQEVPKLIGVTILTSTSQEAMNKELGIPGAVLDTVVHYAKNAKEAGLDGVVCSVHEARAIHEACGDEFLTVTPGIRLAGNSVDDQKRVATPALAKEQGCDMIVVGRSITKAENPAETYSLIEKEISNGRI